MYLAAQSTWWDEKGGVGILLRKVISQRKEAVANESVQRRANFDCVFHVLSSKVRLGILLDKLALPLSPAQPELNQSASNSPA